MMKIQNVNKDPDLYCILYNEYMYEAVKTIFIHLQ